VICLLQPRPNGQVMGSRLLAPPTFLNFWVLPGLYATNVYVALHRGLNWEVNRKKIARFERKVLRARQGHVTVLRALRDVNLRYSQSGNPLLSPL